MGGVNVINDINGARIQLTEYEPWGKISRTDPATNSPDPEKRFTGQILDPESGLYYYGARYYDPDLARFISSDPIVPSPGDPQSLNRYSYVRNNPVKYIDPTGHSFWSAIGNFFKGFGKSLAGLATGIAVGYLTGGLGAPIAGMLGGMAAGAVNSAINGGGFGLSVFTGGVLGGIAGAIGPGIYEHFGGGLGGAIQAGAVTGAILGAINSVISGGDFLQNVAIGALGGGIFAGVQSLAKAGWEYAKQSTDNSSEEGILEPLFNDRGDRVTAGIRACPTCENSGEPKWYEMLRENSPKNRIFGIEYDVNSPFGRAINYISKVHDFFNSWSYEKGNYVSMGKLDIAFDVYSFLGMPIAAVYTGVALAPPTYFQPTYKLDKDSHASMF